MSNCFDPRFLSVHLNLTVFHGENRDCSREHTQSAAVLVRGCDISPLTANAHVRLGTFRLAHAPPGHVWRVLTRFPS
ncbi:MAG: hypothetical protein D6760_00165 [Deltaproteobacteria bacterium]|nr:MAG: hypothetical protein D6760_00165 [Deltaproteobacteria bacterium]